MIIIFKLFARFLAFFILVVVPIGAVIRALIIYKNEVKISNNSLINEIKTEYFTIEITYKILKSGGVMALLKTIKYPQEVRDVIFDGGYNYKNYVIIKGHTIDSLCEKLDSIISVTKDNIFKIEQNYRIIEVNNIMSEEVI